MSHYPLITLTTDFGLTDEYVASMKGVIYTILPEARIVDICHSIPPQDVASASFIFGRAYSYFPHGTVHIIVVDPGVGSARSILAIEAGGQFFIAPDNGTLSAVLERHKNVKLYTISNTKLYRENTTSTFHGRDIMAPVAARVAGGLSLSETGKRIQPEDCVKLDDYTPHVQSDSIHGKVIHIDNFGNICTNITSSLIKNLGSNQTILIKIGDVHIHGLASSYAVAEPNQPLALYDSHNHLEIAINCGSAAENLHIARGDTVSVHITQ
ncbi:SAM hydrolase/SAM-dependent halogenase family protein [Desulfosediminicola flagellatus]|uniref:SAM hydrolase/SAM-dependent halogenase family protein n=1 Tax=Desulfosediminicola flagellatus TaxID=2569541 RepID=UPI0010AD68FE|nr:SAM-dependent chlorinase/fluorinase [Desulfosediminicola flagellatus]